MRSDSRCWRARPSLLLILLWTDKSSHERADSLFSAVGARKLRPWDRTCTAVNPSHHRTDSGTSERWSIRRPADVLRIRRSTGKPYPSPPTGFGFLFRRLVRVGFGVRGTSRKPRTTVSARSPRSPFCSSHAWRSADKFAPISDWCERSARTPPQKPSQWAPTRFADTQVLGLLASALTNDGASPA
jgi:hypothetical protein